MKQIKCPWCSAINTNEYNDLEDNCSSVRIWDPEFFILQCSACDGFFKVKIEPKIIKMKLVEVD